jgi:hypothetical protein
MDCPPGPRCELQVRRSHLDTTLSGNLVLLFSMSMGYAMTQSVEAPLYKPEGRGFDSRWCQWNFSLT